MVIVSSEEITSCASASSPTHSATRRLVANMYGKSHSLGVIWIRAVPISKLGIALPDSALVYWKVVLVLEYQLHLWSKKRLSSRTEVLYHAILHGWTTCFVTPTLSSMPQVYSYLLVLNC